LVVSGEGVYRLLVSPVPERDDAAESHRKMVGVEGAERHRVRGPARVNDFARSVEHRELVRRVPVPDFDQLIAARGGHMLAVRMERDARHEYGMRIFESSHDRSRLAVPDLDRPARARGGQALTVGAEGDAGDAYPPLVVKDDLLDPAKPHEEVPFPLAQVVRTLLEENQGTAQVIRRQFAVGQCDATVVSILTH